MADSVAYALSYLCVATTDDWQKANHLFMLTDQESLSCPIQEYYKMDDPSKWVVLHKSQSPGVFRSTYGERYPTKHIDEYNELITEFFDKRVIGSIMVFRLQVTDGHEIFRMRWNTSAELAFEFIQHGVDFDAHPSSWQQDRYTAITPDFDPDVIEATEENDYVWGDVSGFVHKLGEYIKGK